MLRMIRRVYIKNVLKLLEKNVINNMDKQTALITKEWIIVVSLIAVYQKLKNVLKKMN
jgi:hypothetical protein